jgi:hypothetical protein
MHQPRRLIDVLARQMILEHVRRLNNVIINADQNHVILVHACFLSTALPYGQQFSARILAGVPASPDGMPISAPWSSIWSNPSPGAELAADGFGS